MVLISLLDIVLFILISWKCFAVIQILMLLIFFILLYFLIVHFAKIFFISLFLITFNISLILLRIFYTLIQYAILFKRGIFRALEIFILLKFFIGASIQIHLQLVNEIRSILINKIYQLLLLLPVLLIDAFLAPLGP